MNIYGWQKTSLLDYPGHVATTVFTGSCNFRCPFCHNGDLVLAYKELPLVNEEQILSHLEKRKKILDGVCITGGEPTLQKDLIPFMIKVKEKGLKIKLDTNGYAPEVLQKIIQNKYVDYIAMDVKNSPERYAETVGMKAIDLSRIQKSIDQIRKSEIDYEFRTTIIKELHGETEILEIAKWIEGSKKFCLQQFMQNDKQIVQNKYTSHSPETLIKFKELVMSYFEHVEVRGL